MVETRPPFPQAIFLPDSAFVGRRIELRRFSEIWESVKSRHGHTVFIGGDPGAGKSRLVGEVASACFEDGALVLHGGNSRDLGYPMQPMVEILDQLFAALEPSGIEGLEEQTIDQLSILSGRLSPLAARGNSPGAVEDPLALFKATVDLIRRLGELWPVVLVLEDLHWAGPQTRQLLSYLVNATGREQLLIVGTHRTTAPDRTGELTSMIADLYGLSWVSRMDLPGLETGEIIQYLVETAGIPAAEARQPAAILRDLTGGNPFLIVETWRDLARQGGRDALIARALRAPATVRDMLELRLQTLPAGVVEVIERAAVAGLTVEPGLLIAAGKLEPESVLEALDAAVEFGLMDEAGAGFSFRHSLTRQAVIERMPRHRRAKIHAEVAAALEQVPRRTPETLAALAHHYSEAAPLGFAPQAVKYLALSAHAARHGLAHQEAASGFERAARLAAPAESTELLFESASSLIYAGLLDSARRLYEELAESGDPETLARAAIGYEDSTAQSADPEGSVELLMRALRALPEGTPLYLKALASIGRALRMSGAVVESQRVGELALAGARERGDPELIAHALATVIHGMARPEDLRLQYDRTFELYDLIEPSDKPIQAGLALAIGTTAAYRLGHQEMWERIELCQWLAEFIGQPIMGLAAGCVALTEMLLHGHLEAARQEAHRIRAAGLEFQHNGVEGVFGMQMFAIERATGRIQNLPVELVEAAGTAGGWRPGMLAVYTELGMRSQCAELLPAAIGFCESTTVISAQWSAVAVFAVEAIALLGDIPSAERMKVVLAPFAGTNLMAGHLVMPLGSADRFLALLDHVLGLPSATGLFESALAMDRRIGSVLHEAETLLSFAAHLDSIGDHTRADALRSEGRAIAERIGLRRRIPLESDLPTRHSPKSESVLSGREIDVIRLLAGGKSNREIADELLISVNTAANHVRAILMKTGSTNRTQAAMFAVDHGLIESAP